MAELIYKNDYKEFDYTGNIQSIELLPGKYKLEVWGAQGGPSSWNTSSFPGGYGGYAKGTYTITQKTTIYIGIGGRGYNNSGGYNGGGSGGHSNGGGATHIATANGTLASLASNKSSVIIVAGGGGGCEYQSAGSGGGHGGGANQSGTAGVGDYSDSGNGAGGTISGGYSFGQGGPGNGYHSGSGGGGYYGGYAGDYNNHAGGGGSGFADTTKLTNISGSTGIHEGHGHAKITLLLNLFNICYEHDNGIEDIIINSEKYEVEDTITLTPILKQGYLWDKWTGDIESINEVLTITIEDDKTLISVYANSKPGPTKYTIKHYTQNLDITTYTLQDTEILDGITNDIVYPDIKTYKGFTSPDIQSITLKNDGTTILNYYYTRNKYKAEVISNGTTNKDEYYYEEKGNIVYDKKLNNKYVFTGWRSSYKTKIINNGFNVCEFYMPASDVKFYVTYILNRLNSNIYKNIFPEVVTDMEYINKIIDNIPTSTASIHQDNHNLQIGDVVYLDDDKLYKKALAENTNKSNVVGVVSKVNSSNVFTLMNTGKIDYQHLDYTDTSILYLSDKIPGKLVHYSNISNTVYVPVAIYADNKIIVNIQQGSVGDTLAPYEQEISNFETYDIQDLDDIINQTIGGVLNA